MSMNYYLNNPELKHVIDFMNTQTIAGKSFSDLSGTIIQHDPYMVLADFASYCDIQQKASQLYCAPGQVWQRMSLQNIAQSGYFCADRAIRDYCREIWHV